MSKVLVIHPDDRSTDFLKRIYYDKDYYVINLTNGETEVDIAQAIADHDKIIMMGHGTPSGLINTQRDLSKIDFSSLYSFFIINGDLVPLLREKETISIWCYSDKFFRRYNIPGFHTGMIISEVSEAKMMLGYTPLNAEETLENMNKFADVIHDCIEMTADEMKAYVLEHYTGDDAVTKFNRHSILSLDENGKDADDPVYPLSYSFYNEDDYSGDYSEDDEYLDEEDEEGSLYKVEYDGGIAYFSDYDEAEHFVYDHRGATVADVNGIDTTWLHYNIDDRSFSFDENTGEITFYD